jgi:hypothetical protein
MGCCALVTHPPRALGVLLLRLLHRGAARLVGGREECGGALVLSAQQAVAMQYQPDLQVPPASSKHSQHTPGAGRHRGTHAVVRR